MNESSNIIALLRRKIVETQSKEYHLLATTIHKLPNRLINSMKMIELDLVKTIKHTNKSIVKIKVGKPIILIMPIQELKAHNIIQLLLIKWQEKVH